MGRSIPKPNPIVDAFLMTVLVIELGIIGYALRKEPDLLLLLFGMFGGVACAIKLTKGAFYYVGRFFSRIALQHLGDPLKKRVAMKKWCDQSWQLIHHASMGYLEYLILCEEPWWKDTTTLWNYGSKDAIFPEHKFRIKVLYLAQLAIYIYTAFSCKFLEEMRKDYTIMMTHHVVSIALIVWSYSIGFLPVGVIVLYLHDLSDIPLDLLKMANYVKLEGIRGLFVCEMLFVVLLFEWTYLRVYTYPTKLLYTTLVEARESCMPLAQAHDWFNPSPCPPSYFLFNALLMILYCLHIWWTFLIIRLLVGVLTKGAHETGKDEYEGTSDDSDEDNKED